MTNKQHPITSPDQLVQQWINNAHINQPNMGAICLEVATKAIQWSWEQRGEATEAELQQRADQELEACCEWISGQDWTWTTAQLRDARRPKPPSKAESALNALEHILRHSQTDHGASTIRLALEHLKKLEEATND